MHLFSLVTLVEFGYQIEIDPLLVDIDYCVTCYSAGDVGGTGAHAGYDNGEWIRFARDHDRTILVVIFIIFF